MAAAAWVAYHEGMEDILDGTVDWDTDTIKMILCDAAYTPAATDTAVSNQLSTANGYTDTREAAVRIDMAAGNAATLSSARAYTDQKFGALSQQFDSFRSDVWSRMDKQDERIDQNGAVLKILAQPDVAAQLRDRRDLERLGAARGDFRLDLEDARPPHLEPLLHAPAMRAVPSCPHG